MGDTKNLHDEKAISKIKGLAEQIRTCMFGTYDQGKLCLRPMSTQQIDDEGNFWFLSNRESDKNGQLAKDGRVELMYSQGNEKFLVIHGAASINYDKEKIKELWQPLAKIWFTEGADDPRISVIRVSMNDGYYWDTKHGKMVELAKMAVALLTGKTMDDGIEGKLKKNRSLY
jgi:general stress protein 26